MIAGIRGANIGTAQAYIADSTSTENRAKGMGLIGAAIALGFILGPPRSGILAAIGTRNGLPGNLLPGLVAGGLSFTAFLIALNVLAESKPPGLVPRTGIPPQFDLKLWREIAGTPLLASLLAGLFLFAGGVKLVLPAEELVGPVPMPVPFLRFIGVVLRRALRVRPRSLRPPMEHWA